MRRRVHFRWDEMLVALAVWFCTLPLVALLILPRFGVRFALVTALAILAALALICWGMCGSRILRR